MNRYLILLNWVLASSIVAVVWWLAPHMGGWPLPVGMFLGAMFTAGMVSWQFHKDQSPEKEWKWRRSYFKKDYAIEIVVQLALMLAAFGVSHLFWHGFFMFLTGFFMAWLINILIETLWAKTHRYYNSQNAK